VLRDCVNPVFSARVCLDLLLDLVILESNVKLEALNGRESSLHHCVSGQVKHVALVEFNL